MRAYYNEHEPFAAQWLRNLIAAGHIAPGDVDERDIQDVQPGDLAGYTQCHFFAGIGGWSLALRLAQWDGPGWTASCPCQPFSVASVGDGGAQGVRDPRDLWPTFSALVRECRPPVVFGEQVPASIGWGWWDRAAMELESEGYAVAAFVLRADAVGADHQRRRLYWVADTNGKRRQGHQPVGGVPVGTAETLAVDGHPLVRARRALGGDYVDLLSGNGVSVAVERLRARGYGNAIVPQVAAAFIGAYLDVINGGNQHGDGVAFSELAGR